MRTSTLRHSVFEARGAGVQLLPALLGWAAVACGAGTLRAEPLPPVRIIPAPANGFGVTPRAISGDGSVVAGEYFFQPPGQGTSKRPFKWTGAVSSDLGPGTGPGAGDAWGASADGEYIVGSWNGNVVRWSADGTIETLLDPVGLGAGASYQTQGCSASGRVIVGRVSQNNVERAFLIRDGAAQLLDHPQAIADNSRAWAISADGRTAVGYTFPGVGGAGCVVALKWFNGGTAQTLTSGPRSEAYSVNSNGTLAVGFTCTDGCSGSCQFNTGSSVRWTAAGQVAFGAPPLGGTFFVSCISADGTTSGGRIQASSSAGVTLHACIHRADLGLQDLNFYLPSLGINTAGWEFIDVTAISADGMTVTGTARLGGGLVAYWADLHKDSDGDGLYDDWETQGVPYFDSQFAVQRYALPGANPLRKDIYVEVDAMAGAAPTQATLDRVVAAFDQAPVPAVPGLAGGLPGITLHAMLDDTNLPSRPYLGPDVWQGFHADKAQFFGTSADNASPDRVALLKARAKAYRYCIFCDSIASDTPGYLTLGIGELDTTRPPEGPRMGGNDFMVGLGSFTPPPGVAIEDKQAGTFMHELGHTLGLYHGGGSPSQIHNPNDYSVMNYTWIGPRQFAPPDRRVLLDYSRYALPTLAEYSLNETAGLQGPSELLGVIAPITVRNPSTPGPCLPLPPSANGTCNVSVDSTTCINYVFLYAMSVDWNNDGIISGLDSSNHVCADPNGDGDVTDLTGELVSVNEWALIAYNFRDSPYYSDVSEPIGVPRCPTMPEEDFMTSLPPAPPMTPVCPGPAVVAGTPTPDHQSVCDLGDASITVLPSAGTPPFHVQWRRRDTTQTPPAWINLAPGTAYWGTIIEGTQAATLRFRRTSSLEFGGGPVEVSCRVTDACGQVADSGSAFLRLGGVAITVASPRDIAVCPGGSFTCRVDSSGAVGAVSYQWSANRLDPSDLTDGVLPGGTIVQGSHTTTLTLSNVSPDDFPILPVLFECTATDGCGRAYTDPMLLRSTSGVTFTRRPNSVDLPCEGSGGASVVFTIQAVVAESATYQWMRDGVPAVNGGGVTGADTPSITIVNPQWSDAGVYACRVTTPCGAQDSDEARLSYGPARILSQPSPLPACVDGVAVLSCDALGSDPLSYQWMRNSVDLVDDARTIGSHSATLVLLNLVPSDFAAYTVRVSSPCGPAVTSQPATLVQAVTLVAASQPQNGLTCPTGTATLGFSVTQTQAGQSFNWQMQDPADPANWIFLGDGPLVLGTDACVRLGGAYTTSLTVAFNGTSACGASRRFRCAAYTACQEYFSDPAVITLCRADLNCSGAVNVQDIFDFLAAWFVGSPAGDFNGQNGANVQDIFDFLAAWFAGCS